MPVITVDDLKAHLNLTTDDDDDLLPSKIAAAEEWVVAYTGVPIEEYAGEVPAPVVEAVRRIAADLYENREASLVGASVTELPFGIADLLGPYRLWVF
jgi:uncharacterized phage protein (predicted DNA packaging)